MNSYVAHMFYACSLSNSKAVYNSIYKNKYLLSFNTNTTLFAWGAVNSNKTLSHQLDTLL